MIALSDYLSLKELTTSHVQTQSDTVMTVLSDVDFEISLIQVKVFGYQTINRT